MFDANMDCLVLGCKHYQFLKPILEKILPKNIKIIDSGLAVAKQTKAVLQKHNLIVESTQQGEHAFYTNGSKEVISSLMNWDKSMIQKLD